MSSRALIVASACLAVTLGGCSLAPSSSSSNTAGYTGAKALVASTLNLLASDSSSTNGLDICEHVLGSALRAALNKSGSCQTDVDNQLKTIDDFTLTIESIKVTGKTATARVQTKLNGQKTISTVSLADQKAGWRISSVAQL